MIDSLIKLLILVADLRFCFILIFYWMCGATKRRIKPSQWWPKTVTAENVSLLTHNAHSVLTSRENVAKTSFPAPTTPNLPVERHGALPSRSLCETWRFSVQNPWVGPRHECFYLNPSHALTMKWLSHNTTARHTQISRTSANCSARKRCQRGGQNMMFLKNQTVFVPSRNLFLFLFFLHICENCHLLVTV